MDANATEKWTPPRRRRLYLMRHGDVDYFDAAGKPYRPESVPLNAEGRRQAEAAGRELAAVPLDRVVTSGLLRSVQTAEVAVAGRGLTAKARAELREIETGKLARLAEASADEVQRAFLGALDAEVSWASSFLGGETFASLRERAWPCFQEILADRDWTQLLLVSHGVVNRVLLGGILGAGLSALGALEQDAGCINVIDVDEAGRCLVRLLNHTPLDPVKRGFTTTTMERLYVQYLGGKASGGR
jgi:probable phosphoglycerate mutase